MDHAQWLEERRKGIGGSDVAAILGISPWKTAFAVYQEKRKEVEDWQGNTQTDWGKRMEPTIRQWYSDTTGRPVRVPENNNIIVSKEFPFMFASLDGFTDDGRIVEIKTARHGKAWGEPGTDEIPDYYAVQCHHYMTVTGYEVTDVPVSIAGGSPELYEVKADPETREILIEAEAAFWERVRTGNPPDLVNASDAIARFGKNKAAGPVIAGPFDIANYAELIAVRNSLDQYTEKEDTLKGKLMAAIGNGGDTLVTAEGKILATWKLGKGRASFDKKTLAIEFPDIFKKFSKEGEPSKRFLLK